MSGTDVALRVRVVKQSDERGPAVVVLVAGELDLATAPRLQTRLSTVVHADPAPARVVVDLSGLVFVDASGVSVLLSAQRTLQARGGQLVLRRPGRLVRKVIGLLQLDGALPVED